MAPLPNYLSIDWLLTLFPTKTLEGAQKRIHRFMCEQAVVAYLRKMTPLLLTPDALKRVIPLLRGPNNADSDASADVRSGLRSN
jgi:hypothetical protein